MKSTRPPTDDLDTLGLVARPRCLSPESCREAAGRILSKSTQAGAASPQAKDEGRPSFGNTARPS